MLKSSNAAHFRLPRRSVIFIRDGITVVHSDSKTIANDAASALLEDCKSAAKRRLSHATDPAKVVLDGFAECVRGGVAREMGTVDEEVAFQAGIRETMAGAWESYTCADRDPKGVSSPTPRCRRSSGSRDDNFGLGDFTSERARNDAARTHSPAFS